MRHVFVDGGGNWKHIVDRYLKLSNFDKIWVFEPNPIFYDSYNDSNFILIKKAMWTKDCKMLFYPSKDKNQVGSSLFKEKLCKLHFDYQTDYVSNYWDDPIEVECVDFSKWLLENIKSDDLLTLKLDIEGAEYDVLLKMIEDNTIKMVKKLYVEFHSDTLPHKLEIEEYLIKTLKQFGIQLMDWD